MSEDIEEAMARASEQQRFGSTPPQSDSEEEAEEPQAATAQNDAPTTSKEQQAAMAKDVIVSVDEEFIARYKLGYGVSYDYESMPVPQPAPLATADGAEGEGEAKAPPQRLTKEEKRARKRERAEAETQRVKGWVELDEATNTKVYVSGLPTSIDEEQFTAYMSKCGIVMDEARTGKPKVKLYRDAAGNIKGDGICTYVRAESVELALNILDGGLYDAEHVLSVQRAKFDMKGTYDPTKKKARLTAAQKKRFAEQQQKKFAWVPEKSRSYRPISDCTVVLKNMFALEDIDRNAAIIMDLKAEMKSLYSKFGNLKSVTIYDTNPEGVITLTYDNVEASDLAVKSLDQVIRNGRQIDASLWDGKTKYRVRESAEELQRRDRAWQDFLGGSDDDDEEDGRADDAAHGAKDASRA